MIAIAIYETRLFEEGKHETVIYLTLLAIICVLFGGYLLRYVVLRGGQMLY